MTRDSSWLQHVHRKLEIHWIGSMLLPISCETICIHPCTPPVQQLYTTTSRSVAAQSVQYGQFSRIYCVMALSNQCATWTIGPLLAGIAHSLS